MSSSTGGTFHPAARSKSKQACNLSEVTTLCLQLPKRLARRLMDLQFLPYIVVTNPHIKRVYDSYQNAFETLHKMPQVKTVEQNVEFTVLLKRLVDEHGASSDSCVSSACQKRNLHFV